MRKKDAVAEKTLAKIRKEEDKLAGLELKAAQSGDFFSLQEKLEQASEPHDTSVSADTDAE